jgi:hypothetical protein
VTSPAKAPAKRRGRPRLDGAARVLLQVRVTEADAASVTAAAGRAGVSEAEWMRWAIRRAAGSR